MEIVQRSGGGMVCHHAHHLILALGEEIEPDHLILFVEAADEHAFDVEPAQDDVNEHDFADHHLKNFDKI